MCEAKTAEARKEDEQAYETAGLSGFLTPNGHRLAARVYFADTDFTGVVYHARYLEFLERGRSDFLRLCGVRHPELSEGKHGPQLSWVVRRMEIDFIKPARMDDVILVDTKIEKISGARIFMDQELSREGQLLVKARVEAAVMDSSGRPRRFPKEWARLLSPSS